MPKITSDPATTGDPTLAGQAVPLLNRDENGNEVDWRTQYACTCQPRTPSDPPLTPDQRCPGCRSLFAFLERIRGDRRMREMSSVSNAGHAATGKRKAEPERY